MGILDDLQPVVRRTFRDTWKVRNGQVVPAPKDVQLGNEAVRFEDAVVLYADLVASTALVDSGTWQFAAEIYKSFLHCASKIINANDGNIVSYDGDRVMAIYIGDDMCTRAVKSALQLKGAMELVVVPEYSEFYEHRKDYIVRHVVGIDRSEIHAARTGVRGDNDLVWVGTAANHAAKLCNIRQEYYSTFITYEVMKDMADSEHYSANHGGISIWENDFSSELGRPFYKSSWYRYGF